MGFSCKQTHLILYLEIGSGWPQNKDQPQRIDISQEAKKKNKRKRKTQLSQTNKIPNCRNLACLSLSHLHFFFPPAFCTTCITCATSASLSPAANSTTTATKTPPRPRSELFAISVYPSWSAIQPPPSRSQCAGVVSFFFSFFFKFCFWDFLQPVSQRLCFALCSTTFLERLDLCRQDVNQVSSIVSRASSVGGDSSSSSEANSSRFSQSSYPYGKGNWIRHRTGLQGTRAFWPWTVRQQCTDDLLSKPSRLARDKSIVSH